MQEKAFRQFLTFPALNVELQVTLHSIFFSTLLIKRTECSLSNNNIQPESIPLCHPVIQEFQKSPQESAHEDICLSERFKALKTNCPICRDSSRCCHLLPASSTSLATQWKVWLSFKYSYPRCSTLIQAIDEVRLQYHLKFETPDSTSTLPVSLLQKLVALVTKLNDEPLRK